MYGRPLKPSDDIFDLGGSSLQAVDLINRFEAVLGSVVDIERLIAADSVSQLIDELAPDVPESVER